MAYVLTVNPSSHSRGRKKKGKRKHARAVRRNPANPIRRKRRASRRPHAKRRFRRNPSALAGFGLNQVTGQFLPVALGAGGALLTDIAIDKLPIPIDFKIGNKRHLAKAGVAVGLGLIAGKVMGRDKGTRVMAGALTVVAYDFLKQMLQKQLAPALVQMPATVEGMGYFPELEYENGADMGLLMNNGVGDDDFEEASDFAGMGEVMDF
jgi:hypothetical protein